MSIQPNQQWCGQTQPHDPHIWATNSNTIGVYASCAGYSVKESNNA
jgi:hypothetical protein